ncbi:hypothetical protein [Streptomyces sp. NPDC059649]|uniref:hypothetical protein n=1 Tax=Streptomyces sp. NPDC059649 TaxID=3346895 RepID=UPI0036808B96
MTGWEADLMIGRAASKNRMFSTREYGALTIPGRVARSRTLEMAVDPKKLTTRQFEDLTLIDRDEHRAHFVRDGQGLLAGIAAGMYRIPRIRTSILLDRGWLPYRPNSDTVWISAAGRMAMAFRWRAEQGLNWRLLKGLFLDAALTAASAARPR